MKKNNRLLIVVFAVLALIIGVLKGVDYYRYTKVSKERVSSIQAEFVGETAPSQELSMSMFDVTVYTETGSVYSARSFDIDEKKAPAHGDSFDTKIEYHGSTTTVTVPITRSKVVQYKVGYPTKENVLATIYNNGDLEFTGSGNTMNFANGDTPWADEDYLFFKRRYLQEYDIYKHLNRIKDIPKDLGITLNDVMMMEKEKGFRYLDTQRRLFSSMNKNNVILMPGKPGTGKTTTISGAIRLYKEKNPKAKVCMCAPTARASQVMKESSGYPASTIHSLLKLIPYGNDYLGKNENDQLECDLLIVDEMSMVDTEIFYLLLRAIPNGCQIILCGDPDQIESVGCGSVFRDLLNSNTFCTVTLNQFMRQDAQSSIVQNCKKILEGDPDLIADEQFFIGRYESDEAAKRALLYYYPKDEDCMKHQILSTTKQGKVGTEVLNRTLEGPADADSLIYHDYVYRAGDKVVFVSNNYKAGYCNGDVGVITEIHNGMTVSLGDETVSLGECDLDEILPADVITVHKSQGGEYEDVYVMLPEKPRVLLTRNILNTAVSRARKKVMLFTVRNSLSICVSNVMSHNRDTWLSIFFQQDN